MGLKPYKITVEHSVKGYIEYLSGTKAQVLKALPRAKRAYKDKVYISMTTPAGPRIISEEQLLGMLG